MHRVSIKLFSEQSSRWILPLLQPFQRPILLLGAMTVTASILGLLAPYLTKHLIDDALLQQNMDALLFYSVALFLVGLSALAAGVYNSLLHMRYSLRMLNSIRSSLLLNLLNFSARQHARLRTGEIMSRLDGDASELQRFAFDALLSGGGAIVRLIGSTVFMLWLNWQLCLIVLLLLPVELLFLIWARPITQKHAERTRNQRGQLAAHLNETASAVPVLQSLSAEQQRHQGFLKHQGWLTDSLLKQRLWTEWVNAVPTIASALIRAGILLLGGYWVIQGKLQLGSLIAFLAYIGFMLGPMRTLLGIYHAQARVKAAVSRLDHIALMEPDIKNRPNAVPVHDNVSDINLHSIQYATSHPQRLVLNNFSATIPAAHKIHIDGDSGAGKSTLCALLSRHLDPQGGHINYQNRDIREFELYALRKHIVLVPQQSLLLHGSIAENLRLGTDYLDDRQLWRALKFVELVSWAQQQGGLNSILGERGQNLSGGQQQRLAIARALLQPFKIIIFDESFSEIDKNTSRRIVRRIDWCFKTRTRIIVSHSKDDRLGKFDDVLFLKSLQ